jgi:hypothetical protein
MKIVFEEAKETKGTFKFDEVVTGLAEPKIGSLYVRKGALAELDWAPGKKLEVEITASA